MRLLLDTQILLWTLIEPSKLNRRIQTILKNPEHEILFSAASIWEIAIKAALGRADFLVSAETIAQEALAAGFIELPIGSAAAARVATLPHHHRDPFDRLLVAQAMTEPAMLYTTDGQLEVYSELVVRV
jgi:PIN domain nuclease of toxin-antitoxin system